MGLIYTLLQRLSMTAWKRCKAFLNVQQTLRRIRTDGAQGSSAKNGCKRIRLHLPGHALDREIRSRNQSDFHDPHRATLQVYL